MSEISDTNPNPIKHNAKRLSRWIPVLGFVALIAIGIFAGVESGYCQRRAAQATVVARQVDEQYQLGIEAMDNGQYEIAYQHFEFVVQNNPEFPGLEEALNQLALWSLMSPTPLPSATPTLTPTPDLRAADLIYNQAKQYIAASDWNNAINTLDALRKADPTYQAVDVDGMYYIALRSRGWAKLFPQNCVDTNLEGGIYDLTLAERFGPLDRDADGVRTYVRYYLTGAAFWEVDWVKAQYYFYQTALAYPNLMDSTCETAQERWHHATLEYAKQLISSGDYCGAQEQLDSALPFYSEENIALYPTATFVYQKCHPVRATAVPTSTTGVVETPTEEPTPTATE